MAQQQLIVAAASLLLYSQQTLLCSELLFHALIFARNSIRN
jgi:hypothetical protein